MQHHEFEAPEELQGSIESFWYMQRDFGESESDFEVVPDGYVEIIFYFGSGCSVSSNGDLQPLPSPFLTGLLEQPVLFHSMNRLEIIGVKCFPWAVFDLLGLPSGKHGVRVFEHPIAQLQFVLKQWIEAGKINAAIAQVRQYFLDARSKTSADTVVSKAGVAMRESSGTLPVSQIAAKAHTTIRTLERKFKQSSGYSVKDVSSLIRFEQVRNQLWHGPDTSLAGLAQQLGYTDQSHLSREFKRYSRTTPAAFARKAKQEKQNLNSDFVAFIQSSHESLL